MDPTKIPQDLLRNFPAMKPPPGHRNNLANPGVDGSNATQTIVSLGFLTGLTVIVLILRLYTKFVVLRKPGWDDYASIMATIGAATYASLVIYVFDHGFGVHQWNVSLYTMFSLTKVLNTILYIYKPFMLLAKLSICILFLRLFESSTRLRYAVWFAIVYNVLLQTAAFFTAIFLCIPGSAKFWQCSNKISIQNVVTAGFNIFSDFYLLAIPFCAVWKLQMRTGRKIAVLLVFTAGLLACVSSILGIIWRLKQNASPDVSWNFAPEIILVTFELDATIMVGCFLVLPALFKDKYPLSLSSMWSNRSHIFKPLSYAPSWNSSKASGNWERSGSTKSSLESKKMQTRQAGDNFLTSAVDLS